MSWSWRVALKQLDIECKRARGICIFNAKIDEALGSFGGFYWTVQSSEGKKSILIKLSRKIAFKEGPKHAERKYLFFIIYFIVQFIHIWQWETQTDTDTMNAIQFSLFFSLPFARSLARLEAHKNCCINCLQFTKHEAANERNADIRSDSLSCC